jgi:hypothetical protein
MTQKTFSHTLIFWAVSRKTMRNLKNIFGFTNHKKMHYTHTIIECMRNGLFTVSFHGTRLFFTRKLFHVTVRQPSLHIANRESFFFSRFT